MIHHRRRHTDTTEKINPWTDAVIAAAATLAMLVIGGLMFSALGISSTGEREHAHQLSAPVAGIRKTTHEPREACAPAGTTAASAGRSPSDARDAVTGPDSAATWSMEEWRGASQPGDQDCAPQGS